MPEVDPSSLLGEKDPYSGYDVAALKQAAGGVSAEQEDDPQVAADIANTQAQRDWWQQEKTRRAARKEEGPTGLQYYKQAIQAAFGDSSWPKGEAPDRARQDAEAEMVRERDSGTLAGTPDDLSDRTQLTTKDTLARSAPPPGTPGAPAAPTSITPSLPGEEAPSTTPEAEATPTPEPSPSPAPSRIVHTNPFTGAAISYDGVHPFGDLGRDYDEQISAMEAERDDSTALSKAQGGASVKLDAGAATRAADARARADAVYEEGKKLRDKSQRLTDAYLNYKFDPWGGMSPVAKVFTILGLGLMGPVAAIGIMNNLMGQEIAAQQKEREGLRIGAGHYESLYNLQVNASKNREEAYDKTDAIMKDIAVHDAAREGLAYKDSIHRDQMNQFIALAKQQRDAAFLRASAHAATGVRASSGGAGAGTGEQFIPIEKGVGTVTLKDGTQLLVQKDPTKVAEAVELSQRSEESARDLANFVVDAKGNSTAPNPMTNWAAYQVWVGQLREKLKNTAVEGAAHLGTGSRASVATMQAYSNAIGGSVDKQKGLVDSLLNYPDQVAGQSQAIAKAARTFADAVHQDLPAILHAHGAIVGRKGLAPTVGKGRPAGETREVFYPGPPPKTPLPPSQAPGAPQGQSPAPGAGVPGTTRATNNFRDRFKPGK